MPQNIEEMLSALKTSNEGIHCPQITKILEILVSDRSDSVKSESPASKTPPKKK